MDISSIVFFRGRPSDIAFNDENDLKEDFPKENEKPSSNVPENVEAITDKRLKKICRDKNMYETPELNDVLYFHFQGFPNIPDLNKYFNVKTLFLEGNMISQIEHLDALTQLHALYLQNNLITEMKNLNKLVNLRTLHLGNNRIQRIANLKALVHLDTLTLKNNLIHSSEDCVQLTQCPSLSTLDLSGNRLNDANIFKILLELPNLRTLYLKGNPFLNDFNFYRKFAITQLRNLTYLDDRPIFDNERRIDDAWMRGGHEAVTDLLSRLRDDSREKSEVESMIRNAWAQGARIEADKERKKVSQERMAKKPDYSEARRRYEARVKAMNARIAREAQREHEFSDVEDVGNAVRRFSVRDGVEDVGSVSDEKSEESMVPSQCAVEEATESTNHSDTRLVMLPGMVPEDNDTDSATLVTL